MTERQLKTVMASCPNARFELFEGFNSSLSALNIIGLQLEKAKICHSIPIGEVEEMGLAWKSCPNLKGASFASPSEITNIRAFFLHPKPVLRKAVLNLADADITGICSRTELVVLKYLNCLAFTFQSSLLIHLL